MVAKLWADWIMADNKKYAQVPKLLKDQVKKILIESGREDLVTE